MSFARPLFLRVRSVISNAGLSLFGLPIIALAGLSGCSDPVPPPAQAAWTMMFTHNSLDCEIATHNMAIGDVDDNERRAVVVDGPGGADVACTVKGSGTSFKVSETSALYNGRSLEMAVASISKNSTQAAPAKGLVAYASEKTVDTYVPEANTPCDFYFIPNTGQGVAAGKIWVTFNCPVVIADTSTCTMSGYALFENCATE